MKRNIVVQISVSILVIVFSVSAIYYVHGATYPVIAGRELDNRVRGLEIALPGYSIGDEQRLPVDDSRTLSYWVGTRIEGDTEKKGYVFISIVNGYNYSIRINIGVDDAGKIIGVYAATRTDSSGIDAGSHDNSDSLLNGGFVPGRSLTFMVSPGSRFVKQFNGIDLNKAVKVVDESYLSKYFAEDILARNSVVSPYGDKTTMESVVDAINNNYLKLKKVMIKSAQEKEAELIMKRKK